ncbi:DUF3226 domain-containing protein [Solibacillus silvestris]|uniref:DUF3226 domain-containing protein n=1 Tax=Solibacillus silvestris TaxID=76853 RepID=UPI003F821C17
MKKYYYLIVEGVHDTAAIGRFLKEKNIVLQRNIEQIDPYWERLIPRSFPFKGDLLKRMPVPVFYSNDEYSIAIQAAEGDSGIPKAFNSLLNLEYEQLAGVAVFCDADTKTAQEAFDNLLVQLKEEVDEDYHPLFDNAIIGKVSEQIPAFGIYVFPDNMNTGTLENLLLEGGKIAYPDLLANAQIYVDSISERYRRRNWTISSKEKVLFGVMANALRPGKANQVSIQDNKWISNLTVASTSQNELRSFMADLLK